MPDQEYWIRAGQAELLTLGTELYGVDLASLPDDPFQAILKAASGARGARLVLRPPEPISFAVSVSGSDESSSVTVEVSVLELRPNSLQLEFNGPVPLNDGSRTGWAHGRWYLKNSDGRISVVTPP